MRPHLIFELLILSEIFFALTVGSSLSAPDGFTDRLGCKLIAPGGFNEISAQWIFPRDVP